VVPEDLRDWVDRKRLVDLTLEALLAAHDATGREQREAERPQAMSASATSSRLVPPGPPRHWWSVLTYSYAIGLYLSEEIQARATIDPELRYLSGRSGPPAAALRRFRRIHRAIIGASLSTLLRRAWVERTGAKGLDWPGADVEELFRVVADARINRALLSDTMALDD
jgi:hypothetical protein